MLLSSTLAAGEKCNSSVDSESRRGKRLDILVDLVPCWGDSDFVPDRAFLLRELRLPPGDGRVTDSGRSEVGESCVPGVVLSEGTGVVVRTLKLEDVGKF